MCVYIFKERNGLGREERRVEREKEREETRGVGGESERYQRDRNFNRDMLHFCPEQKQVALLVLNKY